MEADLRLLAEAVIEAERTATDDGSCPWCLMWPPRDTEHKPDCPVLVARRVLSGEGDGS